MAMVIAPVFESLRGIEARLQDEECPHLVGGVLTEVDVHVFVMALRFDLCSYTFLGCSTARFVSLLPAVAEE